MTEQSGRLAGRRIALGITGSIAAYKAVELLRLFQAEGADVRVLMTPSATAFIGPLTLETLSRHPVDIDVLALEDDGRIGHISTANDVEAIVVAPATAHWLGAMANGLAGDSITAACLATSVPVVVAPAMDGGMYAHPATQANVARVREFGYQVVEPELGPLASGMIGRGRLAELWKIVDATVDALTGAPAAAVAATTDVEWASAARPEPAFATPEPAIETTDPAAELEPEPAAEPAAASAAISSSDLAAVSALEPPDASRNDFAGRHVVITAAGTAEPMAVQAQAIAGPAHKASAYSVGLVFPARTSPTTPTIRAAPSTNTVTA